MMNIKKINELNWKADKMAEQAELLEKRGDNVRSMKVWIEVKKIEDRVKMLKEI